MAILGPRFFFCFLDLLAALPLLLLPLFIKLGWMQTGWLFNLPARQARVIFVIGCLLAVLAPPVGSAVGHLATSMLPANPGIALKVFSGLSYAWIWLVLPLNGFYLYVAVFA